MFSGSLVSFRTRRVPPSRSAPPQAVRPLDAWSLLRSSQVSLTVATQPSLLALWGVPELGLDAVADFEVLERFRGGLELMDRTVSLPHRDLALARVHFDDLAPDLLRGLHLALRIAGRLALPQHRSRPQHDERDGESRRQAWPHAHCQPPLSSCCSYRCRRLPQPRRPPPCRSVRLCRRHTPCRSQPPHLPPRPQRRRSSCRSPRARPRASRSQ